MSATFAPDTASRSTRRGSGYWRDLDWILLIAAMTITVFGSMLVWSASRADMASDSDPTSYLRRHAINIGIGIVLGFLVSRVDYRWLRAYTPIVYGLSVVLLIMPFLPGIGATIAGARAWIDLPGGTTLTAEEIRVFPYADPSTHTFKSRLRLAEGQHGIYPGMWVKVRFNTGAQQALLVPAAAIVQRSELTAVYVLAEDGVPRLRQVRLGRRQADGRVAILAGLDAGEAVVTDPEAARMALDAGRG